MLPRLLVVDDSQMVRVAIGVCPGPQGFEVTVAVRVQAGMRALEGAESDAVPVDGFMPRMRGFESIHTCRRKRFNLQALLATVIPCLSPQR